MSTIADRLALSEAVLGLIEKKRAETGDDDPRSRDGARHPRNPILGDRG